MHKTNFYLLLDPGQLLVTNIMSVWCHNPVIANREGSTDHNWYLYQSQEGVQGNSGHGEWELLSYASRSGWRRIDWLHEKKQAVQLCILYLVLWIKMDSSFQGCHPETFISGELTKPQTISDLSIPFAYVHSWFTPRYSLLWGSLHHRVLI